MRNVEKRRGDGVKTIVFSFTWIEKVDQFFTDLFSNLKNMMTWSTFFILLAGVIIGFVICSTIYGILLISSIEQKEKQIIAKENIAADETICKMIDDIKNRYIEETEGLAMKDRFEVLGSKLFEVINKTASVYYPDSKYPLYELNIEELILFMHYLSNRIDDVFDKPILRPFKQMSVSQIMKWLDTKKKIEENKAVKLAKQVKMGKVASTTMTLLKVLNPITWLKKLVVGSTIQFATRNISILIIDIVADETNKTYSKSIFDKEKTLRKVEIEKALMELEREEADA